MKLFHREITKVVNNRINLPVPEYINTSKVEVIIIPVAESKVSKVDYNQYFGVSDIGKPEIDNYLKNIRNEWEKTILD